MFRGNIVICTLVNIFLCFTMFPGTERILCLVNKCVVDLVGAMLCKASIRCKDLNLWVNAQIGCTTDLQPLSGDAGFRRYFRLSAKQGLLAVDAPIETENTKQFLKVAALFHHHGVTVPNIVNVNLEEGFLLIEDWGTKHFGQMVSKESALLMYGEAMAALLGLQKIPVEPSGLPEFNAAVIERELALFSEWFVGGLLQYRLTQKERELLEATFLSITDTALNQPQVVVHRDYHSRNLLVGQSGHLACIDFQDAVKGPFTYDLVSLLKDCYLRLPQEQVEKWALAYGDMAIDAGIIPSVGKKHYLRWFNLMGLQRHIKVLGIFARLHLRDEKSVYLKDLPLVIAYVLEAAVKHREGQEFAAWFSAMLLPECEKQEWYRDYRHVGNDI